jgi:transposase-like protein
MTPLIKRIIEAALQGEAQSHLEPESLEARNRRNGKSSKIVRCDKGSFELEARAFQLPMTIPG